MSRRSQYATVEEVDSDEDVFDDDTDIPLPSRPLPGGARGPLLQALDEEDDYGPGAAFRRPGGAASEMNFSSGGASPSVPTVSDLTPYKKWTCIYPIAVDAKRTFHAGERRIAFVDAVWWPLSKDIADASARLGLGTLHEVSKCHPRDWANPGRVRVQWKKDGGGFVNPTIRTKKQLLAAIAAYIQAVKPELVPKPELMSKPEPRVKASAAGPSSSSSSAKPSGSAKAKQKAPAKAPQSLQDADSPSDALTVMGAFTHTPPLPPPALAVRVSAYSPAVPSGVLVDALKAAMNAAGPEGAGAGGAGAGAGKGKRKVIRVRG